MTTLVLRDDERVVGPEAGGTLRASNRSGVLLDLVPALERVQPRPVTPYYLMISQILQPELSAVVTGIRSPEKAMSSAEHQIRHLLEAR